MRKLRLQARLEQKEAQTREFTHGSAEGHHPASEKPGGTKSLVVS